MSEEVYNLEEDKLKKLFPDFMDARKMFHIDFEEGLVYKRSKNGALRPIGRPTTCGQYTRISVNCPHLTYIWKRGFTDVTAHRLIKYAYDGVLGEIVDHRYKNMEKMREELKDLVKKAKTLDTIHNIRVTTQQGNRANQQKPFRSQKKSKQSTEFQGVTYKYGFYWAFHKKEVLNENGFIHPYLAVEIRNKHMVEIYGDIAIESLDKINQKDLELFKIAQKAIEETEDYKKKHISINLEKEKRKLGSLERKIEAQQNFSFTDHLENL